jgi:hypothetical protein
MEVESQSYILNTPFTKPEIFDLNESKSRMCS